MADFLAMCIFIEVLILSKRSDGDKSKHLRLWSSIQVLATVIIYIVMKAGLEVFKIA